MLWLERCVYFIIYRFSPLLMSFKDLDIFVLSDPGCACRTGLDFYSL